MMASAMLAMYLDTLLFALLSLGYRSLARKILFGF
jgi:hypothetical protein